MVSRHGIPLVTVTPPAAAAVPSPAASGRATPERAPPGQFQDFDNEAVYNQVVAANLDINEQNFVVCFGADEAKVASNLTAPELVHLLDQPRASDLPVRWINIWNPGKQRELVEAIGHHYGFSHRLIMSIWAWDVIKLELRRQRHAQQPPPGHSRGTRRPFSLTTTRPPVSPAPSLTLGHEPSHGRDRSDSTASKSMSLPPVLVKPVPEPDVLVLENLATFQTMQNNLNYTSIDQGIRFVCIGANWLHRRPLPDTESSTPGLVPPKHWSWFALCDDNTVISFHEAASFGKAPAGTDCHAWEAEELANMRANTLKVLRQLSKQGLEQDKHRFMQLTSIRQPMVEQASEEPSNAEKLAFDAASNLFYYLFEDYSAAFDVLNGSRKALDTISSQILEADKWKHKGGTADVIPSLYKLNKDLRQLRNLFTSYKTLIDRLLNSSPPGPAASWVRQQVATRARGRFHRLKVQLQSLMLDAISDYLDEKVSLQDTYFNLMTQKDSRATERLTRSATLLAKLSVFFLPISFMTSYFSVQIPHLTDGYTVRTYWSAFGVIASVSFLCLFFFGKVLMFVSERLDDLADATADWLLDKVGWLARRERRARTSADLDEAF